MSLSMNDARKIIRTREMITEPGKYQVKVTAATPYVREDGRSVVICNLAAMTPYHVAQAKQLFAEGNVQAATNQQLTASPRVGQDYCPQKGELVNINVGWVATKDGSNALLVQSISAIPLTQTRKVNLAMFDDVAEEAEVFDNQAVEA